MSSSWVSSAVSPTRVCTCSCKQETTGRVRNHGSFQDELQGVRYLGHVVSSRRLDTVLDVVEDTVHSGVLCLLPWRQRTGPPTLIKAECEVALLGLIAQKELGEQLAIVSSRVSPFEKLLRGDLEELRDTRSCPLPWHSEALSDSSHDAQQLNKLITR
jgi:hypothetical protein